MTNPLKNLISILLLLFLAPIIIATIQTPLLTAQTEEKGKEKEKEDTVYAAQLGADSTVSKVNAVNTAKIVNDLIVPKKALVYFTHFDEAYKPILAAKGEKIEIYHPENNISSFQEQITAQFALHNLETDFLTTNKATKNYTTVKPFLQDALAHNEYDIILDFHRDSMKKTITTLQSGEESYAKIIFVIGAEHENYKWNEQLANNLSDQLNKLVPGISRGVLVQSGDHVNGVYNQDVAKNLLVVELGGIENTEEELNRSIAILAKAVSNMYYQQIAS